MMIACLRLSIAIVLLMLGTDSSLAHTPSETHSSWNVDGGNVRVDFTVGATESQRLTSDGSIPSLEVLGRYLGQRVSAASSTGKCPSLAAPRSLASVPGFQRLEFQFRCPDAIGLVLRSDAFFEFVPTHVTFAQVQDQHGNFFEQMFVAEHRAIQVSDGAGSDKLESAGFPDYMRMGVMHIFTGIDHMFFLLGLVLISGRLKDLLFVVTGFTLGHSLTLALAVTGIVRPHAEFIDALVALTIVLIGAENIAVASGRSGTIAACLAAALFGMAGLRFTGVGTLPFALLVGAGMFTASYMLIPVQRHDAGRLRILVTLVFGLIHGFGFATDLLESRIPTAKVAELLVGFNLGVEVGQLTVVCAIAGAASRLRLARATLPRALTVDLIGSMLVAVGTCWFITRSF